MRTSFTFTEGLKRMVFMKSPQSKLSLFLLALLILSFSVVFVPVTSASPPVVRNPGFESPGVAPSPNYWNFTTTNFGGVDFVSLYPAPAPPPAHSGSFCVGVSGFNPMAGSNANWTSASVAPVYAGTAYNLSAWIYLFVEGPQILVDIGVDWQNGVGTSLGTLFSPPVSAPSGVWFEHFIGGVAPLGTTQVQIILRVTVLPIGPMDTRLVYYDDVEFYPVGGDTDIGDNTPGNHGNYFDPDADPYNEMLQLNISARTEQLQNLNFSLTGFGTGDDAADITGVHVVHDADGNGLFDTGTESVLATGTYPSDGATIRLNTTHVIPLGQSHLFLFVYELNFASDAGETFWFVVNQITAIGSLSGPLVLPGPPYTSATKTMVGSLTADYGANSPNDHTWTPDGSTPNVVLQIELYAIGEDFTVNNITVQLVGQSGGTPADVQSVLVVHDLDGNGAIDAGEDILATGTGISTQTLTLNPTILVSNRGSVELLIALVIATTAPEGAEFHVTVTALGTVGAVDGSIQVVDLPLTSAVKTIVYPPPGINWFEPPYIYILIAAIGIPIILILLYLLLRRRRRRSD